MGGGKERLWGGATDKIHHYYSLPLSRYASIYFRGVMAPHRRAWLVSGILHFSAPMLAQDHGAFG